LLVLQSAANKDIPKVFISFDFNWYHTGQGYEVGQKVAQYGSRPAQLMVDGKIFVSSFAGDGLDINAMRSAAGKPVFFAPNFHPDMGTDMSGVDGLLNWMAWDNDGNNKAPKPGRYVTVQDGDGAYIKALNGRDYIARKLASVPTRGYKQSLANIHDVQLFLHGSSPTLAPRSPTARTGFSLVICSGITVGCRFWTWVLALSRFLPGMITANPITLGLLAPHI
jgi:hypothetical protein